MKLFPNLLFIPLWIASSGYCCDKPDGSQGAELPPVIRGYGNLHVFRNEEGIRIIAARALGSPLDTVIVDASDDIKFRYYSAGEGPDISFEFTLHEDTDHPWSITEPEKTLVVSDFHGRLDAFAAVLKGNGVVDRELNWSYGTNSLVVLGDMLDRGRDDNGIAWLMYKLEKQAEDAGGRVGFTPGNHEDMVLKNDLRYVHEDHLTFAERAGIPYAELYGADTELGGWIRDKHLVLTLGDNVFVHGGLSTEMTGGGYTISEINERGRRWVGYPNKERNAMDPRNEPLFGTNGALWYRGEVTEDDPISSEDLNRVLEYYNAGRIVVGHSEVPEVEWRYGGRVVAVNVKHATNYPQKRTAGILIEQDNIYSVDYYGEKTLLGPVDNIL